MRVLIVDDHQIVRRGVRSLLEAEKGVEVCGEAANGREAISKAVELKPDAIVMDISMPDLDGIEATRKIIDLYPRTRIVILSHHDVPHLMRQALNAGAGAYVVKSAASTDLIPALKQFRDGETPDGLWCLEAPKQMEAQMKFCGAVWRWRPLCEKAKNVSG
jgi:DNA-binding NarL/FixJ family response regulator